jgi:hypothetical protein
VKKNAGHLLLILAFIGIILALVLGGCAPGLGRDNPIPAPNPDHGAQPPQASSRNEVIFYFDVMGPGQNEYVNRQITGDIGCTQANGKPAIMLDSAQRPLPNPTIFNGRTNYDYINNEGLPPQEARGGVEVHLFYAPGVASCKVTALVNADPGEKLFLDVLYGEIGFNLYQGTEARYRGGQRDCEVPAGGAGCFIETVALLA